MESKIIEETKAISIRSKATLPPLSYYQELDNNMNSDKFFLTCTQPMHQLTYFETVTMPYIANSVIGSLHSWEQQLKNHDFIFAPWFHKTGFKEVFLSAFESAFSRLRYTKVNHPFHTLSDYLTATNSTASHLTTNNYLTTLFWFVDNTTGVGYIGDRQGNVELSLAIREKLVTLPQYVLNSVMQSVVLSHWNWRERNTGSIKKQSYPQLHPPIRQETNDNTFSIDYSSICLLVEPEDPNNRNRNANAKKRANHRPLDNRGLSHFLAKLPKPNKLIPTSVESEVKLETPDTQVQHLLLELKVNVQSMIFRINNLESMLQTPPVDTIDRVTAKFAHLLVDVPKLDYRLRLLERREDMDFLGMTPNDDSNIYTPSSEHPYDSEMRIHRK